MSCQTDADDYRDQAVKEIDKAVKSLSRIFADKCSGWDDYNKEYMDKLRKAWLQLIEIQGELS